MTRKSEVALIYKDPLAHRRKAVCFTKGTPNLLRDMLNIPPLLGKKELSICPFYGCNSKQSAGLHPILLLVFSENQRDHEGKRDLWVGGLAAGWKEGLLWSQCGMVSAKLELFFGGFWEDFRISHWHLITEANPTEEILISFWMWKLFLFKVPASSLHIDWFLSVSVSLDYFLETHSLFSFCCGWKLYFQSNWIGLNDIKD